MKATAKYFDVNVDSLKKFFIKNDLPYHKKIRYICDDNFFSQDNELSFYWAGFMAADGNVSRQNDICIILKSSDYGHLVKFQRDIKTDSPITYGSSKRKSIVIDQKIHNVIPSKNVRIRIRSHKMAKDLERFNIVPAKTKGYDIPDWLVGHSLFHHFIRGYFDGDGWFTKTYIKRDKKYRITFGICGNLSPMKKIERYLVEKCKTTGKPYIIKQRNIYKITFAKQHDITNIIKLLYEMASVFLDRKYELSKLAIQIDEESHLLHFEEKTLRALYKKLGSYKKVAEKLGCCISSVANHIKKYDITK